MAVLMHVIDSADEVDVEAAGVLSVIARNLCDVKQYWACLEFFVSGIC